MLAHPAPAEPAAAVPACGGDCRTCPSAGSCGDRLVCRCLRVTEAAVIAAVRGGAGSVRDLRAATGAGGGCMCCHRELKRYLTIYSSPSPSPAVICSAR
jgi:bacterioferritin-associated ferredoxin